MSTDQTGTASRRSAERLLEMVGELHRQGYQRLRVIPGMAPSGMYWRCAITPRGNVTGAVGLDEGPDERLVVRYSTADEARFFGWSDASRLDARQLASCFIERLPEIAGEAAGEDWPYAGWFVQMLGLVELGFFPISYSDYGDDCTEFMPLIAVETETEMPRLPLPPFGRP